MADIKILRKLILGSAILQSFFIIPLPSIRYVNQLINQKNNSPELEK